VAVASAGQYASLHLAPNRQPHQHLTTQSFTGRMPFLPPNQQRHSTEGHLLLGTCQKKSNFEKKQGCGTLYQLTFASYPLTVSRSNSFRFI